MDKLIAPNCSDVAQWRGLKTECMRLSSSNATALCGTALGKAKMCHSQFVTNATVACVNQGPLGLITDTTERCAYDILLGVLCASTVNSRACAGVQCRYNADCSSGSTCNDKTDRCVEMTARCPGLPCRYNADCPSGFTCNNATEQCNAG